MSLSELIQFASGLGFASDNKQVFERLLDTTSDLSRVMRQLELVSKRALSRHAYDACKVFPDELESLATDKRQSLRKEVRQTLLNTRELSPAERSQAIAEMLQRVGGDLHVYEEVMVEMVRQRAGTLALTNQMAEGLSLLEQVLTLFRSRIGCLNRLYGMLIQEYGRLLYIGGRHEASAEALLEATDVLLVTAGPHAKATLIALANFGQTLHATRDLEKALEVYERLCTWLGELTEVNDDRGRLPHAWLSRASVRFDLGDLEGSRDDAERSLQTFRSGGDAQIRHVADALSLLGRVSDDSGEAQAAEAYYRESIDLMGKAKSLRLTGTAWTQLQLARLLLRQQRHDEAWAFIKAARSVYEDEGWREKPLFAAVEDATSRCLHARGDLDGALLHARRGLEIARRSMAADPQFSVGHASNLGVLLMENGELSEAAQAIEEALKLLTSRQVPHPEAEGLLRCNLALVAERRGDLTNARELLEESRRTISQANRPVVLGNLLRVLRSLGGIEPQKQAKLLEAEHAPEIPSTPLMVIPEILAA